MWQHAGYICCSLLQPHSAPRSCCILLLARKHLPSTSGLHSLIAKPLRERAKALGIVCAGKVNFSDLDIKGLVHPNMKNNLLLRMAIRTRDFLSSVERKTRIIYWCFSMQLLVLSSFKKDARTHKAQ